MEATLMERAKAAAEKAAHEVIIASKNEGLRAAETKSVENGRSTSEAGLIRYFAIGIMALAAAIGYDMPDQMQMHLFEIVAAVLGLFGVSFGSMRTSRKNNADRLAEASAIETTAVVTE